MRLWLPCSQRAIRTMPALSGTAGIVLILAVGAAPLQTEPRGDFEADIKPILEKSCIGCHGPKAQMGQLRLDIRSAALKGGQSGSLLTPGKPAESILYQRVAGQGDQARMPMGGKLTPEQIAKVSSWIEQGAPWPESPQEAKGEIRKHWAFIPPQRPAEPVTSNSAWAVNPIDKFILARLEKENLQPSESADAVTLLRRLSLDLTGLPPTLEEVDTFLADGSPNAYAKQVDRLLKSPHYGERWARVWLDAARYADSDGYEKDKPRQVWFYRDWVINAFNRNLGYDQFVVKQIAGDLLPDATQDDRVATGFLRNSMLNEEGGVNPEQFRVEALFDRMEAVGKGILGVTIQCAQCHNHKFDPIRQEDYYRILAFLNDSYEANMAVYTPQEQVQRATVLRRIDEVEAALQRSNTDWKQRLAAWETSVRATQGNWTVLSFSSEQLSAGGQKLIPQEDGSMLAQGDAGGTSKQKLTTKSSLPVITGLRLEVLTDPNLPRNGPGRSTKGNFALSEIRVEAGPGGDAVGRGKPDKVKISSATADINLPEAPLPAIFDTDKKVKSVTGPAAFAIDGKNETAWWSDAGPGQRNQARKAVFQFAEPVSYPDGALLTIHLDQNHGQGNFRNNNLGRYRLSVTSDPNPVADPLPAAVRDILSVPDERRTPAQRKTVFSYWRTTVPEWQAENDRIAALWREYPEGSEQLVMQRRETPRKTHLLTRGDYLKPAKEVTPGVPAFLNALPAMAPDKRPDRLDFAKWLVDRQAPTTARAFVNRVWQSYFGAGLVTTSEDLGTQSAAPTHPELLDWLAVEFMDSGWDIHRLHRLIVMSATYRQSSRITPEMLQRDPDNRLLARGSRFRVDAESVRDIALAASGLLNSAVGGPSVYPPAPEYLFRRPVSFSDKDWFTSRDDNRYRRSLYTFRYRSILYPVLQAFDAPTGESSCVRRPRSNTPLQALTLLNEPMFVEAAQALARVTLEQGGTGDEERVRYAFRRAAGRNPSSAETAELLSLLERQQRLFADPAREPEKLADLTGAHAKPPAGVTATQSAAWTTVCRVLLNLDETITRE